MNNCKIFALVVQGDIPIITSVLTSVVSKQPPVPRTAGVDWKEITGAASVTILTNGLQYRPSTQWRYIYVDGGSIQELPDNG